MGKNLKYYSDKKIVGVDPGNAGAIVILHGNKFSYELMPMLDKDEEGGIDFNKLYDIFLEHTDGFAVIEKPTPYGLNAKGAFTYGAGFQSLMNVLQLTEIPFVKVQPSLWAKEMHVGIDKKYRAKEKSLMAFKKHFPHLIDKVPTGVRSKKFHDGVVDALLIAGYGTTLV